MVLRVFRMGLNLLESDRPSGTVCCVMNSPNQEHAPKLPVHEGFTEVEQMKSTMLKTALYYIILVPCLLFGGAAVVWALSLAIRFLLSNQPGH